MISATAPKINLPVVSGSFGRIFAAFFLSFFLFLTIYAQDGTILRDNLLIIDDVKDTEVFALGKTVIVKNQAKGVLVLGGDIIVEGKVTEDVATIGGSIYQKDNAFIGGDVIVIGGKYQSERREPLRNPEKETVMIASYEEELRNLMQNPAQIFSPAFTWAYLAQRLLSTLFWFIVSLILITIAPGAISRAVARVQLSTLKIVGIGFLAFIVTTTGVITGFSFLPSYLSGIIGLMATLMMILAYVYGRVALQVSFGKWLQKRVLAGRADSESVAVLIGTLMWTLITSIPYLGVLAVLLIFAVSLGLVITSCSPTNWQKV